MKHNWEYKPLGEVCDIKSGYTPSSDNLFPTGDFPYFKVAEMNLIGNEKYLQVSPSYISGDVKTFPANAIVFPKNGAAVATNKKRILRQPSVVDLNTAVLITHQEAFVEYIYHIIQHIDFGDYVKRGTVPTLNIPELKQIEIPLPSLEIQKRIVTELDALNGTIAKCRELLATLDSLAQSLFYDTFAKFQDTVPLSHYVVSLKGGKSLAGDEINENKVLKSGAVTYDYFDKFSTKYLPAEYEPIEDHKVNKGDLLISRMNTAELVGACAYVFDVEDNTYLPDRLWRIEYKHNANAIFLWKSLISDQCKEQIRAKASGTSGSMKNISKPLLLTVMVKDAPLSVQESFARKIETIEAEKKKVEATMAEVQTLLDSRMDYWFN